MELAHLMQQLGMVLSAFCLITAAQAGIPVWSFSPDSSFPPHTTVSTTGTATVKYTISNNSTKAHNLVIKPQTGVTQNGACLLNAKGSANSTCKLTLTITGSVLSDSGLSGGPVLCQANLDGSPNPNQCYRPSKADSLNITVAQGTPILSVSTTSLALSISGLTLNGQSSGQSRVITITNTGDDSATGLSINYPLWPTGTVVDMSSTSACIAGSTLVAGGSCTITVAPGSTATSGAGNAACTTGIAPIPGVISVTATNANQVSTNVVVLGYGCIYQGGFIYAITETTDKSKSIGGTVTSFSDQASQFHNGVIWSSNGSGGTGSDVSEDTIPLIAETSTPSDSYSQAKTTFNNNYSNTNTFPFPESDSFASCNGAYDGQCDTGNILTLYNTYRTNYGIGSNPYTLAAGPTNLTYFAAGLCSNYTIDSLGNSPCSTGTCYNNWYLPAICEMGPVSNASGCAASTQNIINNIPDLIGNPNSGNPSTSCTLGANCLAGNYWSSTEYSGGPWLIAWVQYFASGGSMQSSYSKNFQHGVRCSRALTF